VYWVVLVLVVPMMVYWPMRLSTRELANNRCSDVADELQALHPNWVEYSHRLSQSYVSRPVVSLASQRGQLKADN
jgi:hypothetical protein